MEPKQITTTVTLNRDTHVTHVAVEFSDGRKREFDAPTTIGVTFMQWLIPALDLADATGAG